MKHFDSFSISASLYNIMILCTYVCTSHCYHNIVVIITNAVCCVIAGDQSEDEASPRQMVILPCRHYDGELF